MIKLKEIVWLKDISKESGNVAGGKGANLAEMYNLKLPVPNAFIVTAQAYKRFLEESQLSSPIFNLLKELEVEDSNKLKETAEKIQEMIIDADMPDSTKRRIIESYENMNISIDIDDIANKQVSSFIKAGRDLPYVAVRSSATAEDLTSISKNEHVLVKIDNKTYFRTVEEIYNLVGDGKNYDIEIPAMKNYKIQWVKVESLYKHKAKNKDKLYKIKTETGREIIVSPNHTLIVLDEDTLQSKEIKSIHELKGNEKLPAINELPILDIKQKEIDVLDYIDGSDIIEEDGILRIKNNSNNWKIQSGLPRKLKITKDLAYFLGIYCAEGSNYGVNEIIITNKDKTIMERIIDFVSYLGLYNNQKINKNSLRFYNKTFLRFLSNVAGTPNPKIRGKGKICRNKKVPEFIFGWNKELIGEFLRGCFDGDGHSGNDSLSYCSTSKMLISGIIKLLEMLGIRWYLNEYKNILREDSKSYNIVIQPFSLEKFSKLIGFESITKQKKLDNFTKKYKKQKKHPEFLNSIYPSPKLSRYLRIKYEESLPKQKTLANFCPTCNKEIPRFGKRYGKKSFYCKHCHKSFYEKDIKKKEIMKYVYYDSKGRFIKKKIPWNKGMLSQRYSINLFKELLAKNNLNFESLNNSIKWDQIKEINEINYNDYVYDFCVPEVENFAAGIGGIITHNSASFAGQMSTFLDIKGSQKLIKAVQGCWASLFTARAIYYRTKNNFPHEKVFIAVVIQKQIHSERSGVIFSANPLTNNENEIMIEAVFGLGEAIVSGSVSPDQYILDKETLEIKNKHISKKDFEIYLDINTKETKERILDEEKSNEQVLNESQIRKLGEYTKTIEKHYQKPQDIEFAIENGSIYIVQSRPITTLKKSAENEEVKEHGEVILKGVPASPHIGSGRVKIVKDISELHKVQDGDILVAKMTNPDYVAGMQRAKGIITNEGGAACHAAIVSREMGIACVVGTENATEVLKDNDLVTVDGVNGLIYKGEIEIKQEEVSEELEIPVTATKIYMNLGEPNIIDKYKNLNFDGIGLMRLEFLITSKIGKHPNFLIKEGQQDFYVNEIVEGISKVASAINPRPITVRFSDFKTNEYRNLEGGSEYEEDENNPMIGWRGVSRYISRDFREAFELECQAIKKVRENLNNVNVMLPFVRNTDEVKKCLDIMKEQGLERSHNFKVFLMAEVPSIALIPEEFAKLDIDGVSIGSNDLTQLVLGVDRDSAKLYKLGYFDERNQAVLKAMERIIKSFKDNNKFVSICGQAPSQYTEIVEFLVKNKIDAISVNPDVVNKTRRLVASVERKILMEMSH